MSVTISVVIPVYNGANFIADTIRSVLNQTYTNYEVVVVNDGSKDGTIEQLAQFGDAIKLISIPNGGVSNARNVGIRASSGDYIAFLDADDLWVPQKLERQLAAMLRAPSVGFSCSNYMVRAGNEDIEHFSRFRQDARGIVTDVPLTSALENLIKNNFVGTCSNVMVKRQILEQSGLFDTAYRQAEDYDLWLRCAMVTDFLLISSVLMSKTTHDTNLTNNFVETLHCHEMVLMKFQRSAAVSSRPHLIPMIDAELASVRYSIGDLYFNRGKFGACSKYFLAALKSQYSIRNTGRFLTYSVRKIVRLLLEILHLRAPYREI
jgi:glycosyltransferase involved in cell wall biosynthesis